MSERRSYFRIDESIALEFKPVDATSANTTTAELQFPGSNSLKLYAELRKLDAENLHLFHQIKETNRALGEYLHNLDRKIEIISQQIMVESKPLPPSKLIMQVNLSEGGIAFGSSLQVPDNSFIAIRLVFLPSNACMILYAKIIRCAQDKNGEFQIAAKFYRITEAQQQLIGQQIMHAQMAERRKSKQVLQ